MSTAWVADTHVHLYPEYDLGRLFRAAIANLRALAGGSEDRLALFLTERAGTHLFDALQQGEASLPDAVSVTSRGACLEVTHEEETLAVWPGRQIVTAERIEVLSLASKGEVPDGSPLEETLHQVRERGGLPVLPWSPGKWMGGRGVTIREQIERSEPGRFFIGDILMRPRNAPEPPAFRLARERGFTVLAGTDPLPLPKEEQQVGRYAVRMQGDSPCEALPSAEIVGERQRLVAAGLRWARQYRQGPKR